MVRNAPLFLILLAACGGADDGTSAAPTSAGPAAAESPREAAERLTGLKFSKPPALATVDDAAFLDAALRIRGVTPSRLWLYQAAGLHEAGDPAAQAREILAKEDLAAFHSPEENKIYEKTNWQPWMDYQRSPEYWRSHQKALVTRAFVVALLREHHPAARQANSFPDDGIRLTLTAATDAEATLAVAPLIATALVKETRREGQFREAKEEDVRAFLLKDRLPVSHLGKPATLEQAVAMASGFDRYRNVDESSVAFLHLRQRQRQRSIAAAEVEAARRRASGGGSLIQDPPIAFRWPGEPSYGPPPKRTHLRFRTPQTLLGAGWTLVEEGTLAHSFFGDRFALFKQGDRSAAVLCQIHPVQQGIPRFIRTPRSPNGSAVGGIYGPYLVAAAGIDDAAFQESLPRILRNLIPLESDRFKEISAFHTAAPPPPDASGDLARLKSAPTGTILSALPAACQRHPDRAPAWIAEFTPAFLAALDEARGITYTEKPLQLLGLAPYAVSPEAWKALLDAVAAAGTVEKSPVDGSDRYKMPGFFAADDPRPLPGDRRRDPPFSNFKQTPRQDLRPADAALLMELQERAAGTIAGMWILKHLDELKRLAQTGNTALAVELARKYRTSTTDPKALAGLDAILESSASAAGIESWRGGFPELRDPRYLLSGTVLYAAGGRQSFAIDLATGRELWRSEAPEALSAWKLWESGEGVFAVCGMGTLVGWSKKDGSLLWEKKLGRPVMNAAVSGRVILIEAPTLPAFDLSTGKAAWALGADAQVLHGDGDGVLVRKASGNELAWLDPASGKERWKAPGFEPAEVRLSLRHGAKLLVRGREETAEVDLGAGRVVRLLRGVLTHHATEGYAVLMAGPRPDEGFSVIDRTTGKAAWSKRSGHVLHLSSDGCGWSDRDGFYWSDPATGRPRWAATPPSSLAFALSFPGTVVLATGYSLHGHDAATGTELWKFAADPLTWEAGWAVGGQAVARGRSSARLISVTAVKKN